MGLDSLQMMQQIQAAETQLIFESFKNTVAGLYRAVNVMQPVMEQQLLAMESQRFFANLFLFCFFAAVVVFFVLLHKRTRRTVDDMKKKLIEYGMSDEEVTKSWPFKLKKRMFITVLSGMFLICYVLFNVLSGSMLMTANEMLKQAVSAEGVGAAAKELFGE